jgi:antitoxin component YwqK of YwqJK toxin-antitoxin module
MDMELPIYEMVIGNIPENKPDGKYVVFWSSGDLFFKTTFINNREVGNYLEYAWTGELIVKSRYNHRGNLEGITIVE